MKRAVILIGVALTIAACGSKPTVNEKNASVAEVAQAVRESAAAGDTYLQPGEWHVTSVIDDMSIPGMPAAAQAQMKKSIMKAPNTDFRYCLTEEEARHPGGKFFTGKENKNCRYDHFTMGGGKIDAALKCNQTDTGQIMAMTMAGTYSPEAYENRLTMTIEGGREQGMSMKMHAEAKRVGACTEKESKQS
jgi:hypothetical protein